MHRSTLLTCAAALALLAPATTATAAAPPNDAFTAPTVLAGPGIAPGTVAEATDEPGEPAYAGSRRGATVWYAFTPAETAPYVVDTCTSQFDTILGVYEGAALASLREIGVSDDACGRGSRVTFSATAGTTYRFVVAAFRALGSGEPATFSLQLRLLTRAANDAFARAVRLTGPGRVRGSNVLATNELGEPRHARVGGTKSLWYRYRAPRTETLTIDTVGSTFDTVLAVYRGNLGNLRPVASNDDIARGTTASQVRVRVVRGATYSIAVDGLRDGDSTEEGDVELGISDGGARGVGLVVTVLPGQTLSSVRGGGLDTSVRCVRTCRVDLELRIGAATARQLGLGRRALTIARTSGTLGLADPERPATLVLSRGAQRALAGRERLVASLVTRLRGSAARDRVVRRAVALAG